MKQLRVRGLALLSMRPGEVLRASLCFAYLFLIIASYLLIKAVRSALFISEFGAVKLPYVMIGIAVLAGLFAALYIRLSRRFPQPTLIFGSLMFFASNLLVFWWLAKSGKSWLFPVLYIWGGVFGVIAPTQVWTLANDLFTTREAKRLFGFIGAGGILGATVGGSLAFRYAPIVGAPNLLLVVVVALVLASFIVKVLARYRGAIVISTEARASRPKNLRESLRQISRSRLLRNLGALVFISALCTTSIDFQFNLVAGEAISGRDNLASFFGIVFGGTSLIGFLIQLFATSRLLAFAGVGFSLLLLPVTLLSGSVGLLWTRSVAAAVLLKGGDGALKHSVDRASRELLYLPLPQSVKLDAKSTIDTVMDRLGDGSAGLIQLVITALLGLGLAASLSFNIFALAAWVVIVIRVKRCYVHELRSALASAKTPTLLLEGDDEAEARRVLEQMLGEGTEAQKLAALEWLAERPTMLADHALLERIKDDSSPAVRQAALTVMLGEGAGELPEELAGGLEREGHQALVSVIEMLVEPDSPHNRQDLERLLDGMGESARLPLIALLVRRLGAEFEPFAERVFEALVQPASPPVTRRAAARTLALMPRSSRLQRFLPELLEDSDPQVAAAAAESAARLGRDDLVPSLVALLERPRARIRVRRALREIGLQAVPPVTATLLNPASTPAVRLQLPRLLAEIGSRQAVTALEEGLDDSDLTVRDRCLAGLYRMRRRSPDRVRVHRPAQRRRVLEACEYHSRIGAAQEALVTGGADSEACRLLTDALTGARRQNLERILRLLALDYPVADIDRVLHNLSSGSRVHRANALELLDNILPPQLKRRILVVIEENGMVATVTGVRLVTSGLESSLRELITGEDSFLAAAALHYARVAAIGGVGEAARQVRDSKATSVKEEALLLLAARPPQEAR